MNILYFDIFNIISPIYIDIILIEKIIITEIILTNYSMNSISFPGS